MLANSGLKKYIECCCPIKTKRIKHFLCLIFNDYFYTYV